MSRADFSDLPVEIVDLVHPIELGLDDPGIFTFLDLLVQVVPWAKGNDLNKQIRKVNIPGSSRPSSMG